MVFRASFPLSFALHGAALALVWLLPAPVPRTELEAERGISYIPLVSPPAPARRVARKSLAAAPPGASAPEPRRLAYLIPPRPSQPVLTAPEVRSAALRPAAMPSVPELAAPAPPPVAAGFENPAEQAPPERQSRLQLRTGAFDAALPVSQRPPERAGGSPAGSFDIIREPGEAQAGVRMEPSGAVFAAVTAAPAAGASRVRTQAGAGTAGFAPASTEVAPAPPRRTASEAGFAVAAAAAAPPPARRQSPPPAVEQGVTILEKPRPDYTPEARAARIEGEVLLEVVFTAGGEVRVRRVRQGLGHGLDENAVAAARRIRFRPATAGGRAVDFEAIIRVAFRLAY